ncbi:MAG TPA: selenocysteine-specific translation elongation factor [Acidimicrobiales bacterium]|nr:selenocysteine-specific translation elongation factor [Acidimicrobiales bacterium]
MRVVATAGHVDHGKSSLVLALTGTDPDRFEEEKRRGLTIDLGFAHTVLPSGAGISFVDVPGHIRFLRNMLAGVGAVDACLFVVAATEGWKPQSEEHLRILELLGIGHGVIALTKADAVDAEWLELATLDVHDHVSATFLDGAPVVPVSSTTGEGLDLLRRALDDLVVRTPGAPDRIRPRLWVDRVFAAKGSGTVVTGTLTGGGLSAGDQVVVGPAQRAARIRAIQTLNHGVDRIGPGHRVALNLVGVERGEVARGDAVVEPGRWRPTSRCDATLAVLGSVDHDVTRRGAYAAYVGSGEHPVKVRVLAGSAIAPGTAGLVRLHLAQAVPLLPGDHYVLRELGRNETVGGGQILDVAPVRPASKVRADLAAVDVADRVVAERGWVLADELEALTGQSRPPTVGPWVAAPGQIEAMIERLTARVVDAGPLGLDVATLDDRERAVLGRVPGVETTGGRARVGGVRDPLADHPYLADLEAAGMAPPPPAGIDRAELRELVRRGLVVERDGVYFAASAIEAASRAAAELLARAPEGFTVAELRDAVGITRKHALPLVNELDVRGVTRRRGDLRVAGPRLPTVEA